MVRLVKKLCYTTQFPLWVLVILITGIGPLAAEPMKPSGAASICSTDNGGTPSCINAVLTKEAAPINVDISNFHPGYFMLVGSSEGTSAFDLIVDNPNFVGVKKFYKWVDLEVSPGVYDFSPIANDLSYLQQRGKRLWIQIIETVNVSTETPWVPKYMWKDTSYGCGTTYYGTYERTVNAGGWFPCYWNAKVRNAYYDLYTALGNRFNTEPYFEGIALSETSAGSCTGCGYSVAVLEDFFKTAAVRTKQAFPNKVVLQMINYAPFDLVTFAAYCVKNNIGLAGPDVHLNESVKVSLNTVVYPLYLKYHDVAVTGIDVQWDNYERWGQTVPQILNGAIQKTDPYYMFWEKRQPYFSDGVVPLLSTFGLLPAAKAYYQSLN